MSGLMFSSLSFINLMKIAEDELHNRKLRNECIVNEYMDDIVWDILLYLFVDRIRRSKTQVSNLTSCITFPVSPLQRWLRQLIEAGLVTCNSADQLSGEAIVELSDRGFKIVQSYMERRR